MGSSPSRSPSELQAAVSMQARFARARNTEVIALVALAERLATYYILKSSEPVP